MLTKLRTENDVSREGRCDMSAEPKQNPAVHGGRWWSENKVAVAGGRSNCEKRRDEGDGWHVITMFQGSSGDRVRP